MAWKPVFCATCCKSGKLLCFIKYKSAFHPPKNVYLWAFFSNFMQSVVLNHWLSVSLSRNLFIVANSNPSQKKIFFTLYNLLPIPVSIHGINIQICHFIRIIMLPKSDQAIFIFLSKNILCIICTGNIRFFCRLFALKWPY